MPTSPFKVKAVYEYKSAEPDDLNFPNGQIITVTEEEDDDWYTGNYVDASGETREGLFPRNFVEKYEPAIPSRPVRARPKVEAVEATQPVTAPQDTRDGSNDAKTSEELQEAEIEPLVPSSSPSQPQAIAKSLPPASAEAPTLSAAKPAASKPPPPVAEKPSSDSFRSRLNMFNQGAAVPVTPFKPESQNKSSGFIKKPFVPPPPGKDSYIPPPREQPPPKVYRREEDHDMVRGDPPADMINDAPVAASGEEEEQPKPTTLKERIALLQKQQLEQAARHADSVQKKEKPKRPPKKRVESTEAVESADTVPNAPLARVDTNETVGKKSVDFADDEAGPLRGASNRQGTNDRNMATPPPPPQELVSDTNDADDSGAGDTEDAHDVSTEEDRPRSRHDEQMPGSFTSGPQAMAHDKDEEADEGEGEDVEEEDTDEDPEVRKKRELRERMARLGGGMGMMNMFGPPGGMPAPSSARKPKHSKESDRRLSQEQTREDAMAKAPPVPIMAMPGMTRLQPSDDPEPESDEDETARPMPQEPGPRQLSDGDDDLPQPLPRRPTERSAPPVPQERGLAPLPPRETRAVPPPPAERPVPARPQSSEFASAPSPPPRTRTAPATEEFDNIRPQSKDGPPSLPPAPPRRRPTDPPQLDTSPPMSPSSADKRLSRGPPPMPMGSPTATSPQARAPPPPPPNQPPSRTNTNDSRMSSKHQIENDSEEEITEYDGDYDTDIASSAKHKDALKSHNRDSSLDEGILTDEAKKSPMIPSARSIPAIPITSPTRDVPPPLPQQSAPKRQSSEAPRAAPPPVPPPKDALEEDDYDPYRYNPNQQSIPSPPIRSQYAPSLSSPREELEQDNMYDPTPTATRSMPAPPTERGPPPPPSSAAPMMSGAMPMMMIDPSRPSTEMKRTSTQARRSMDQSRTSGEHGIVASDIDLGQASMWWTHENTPPPALQNRNDILYEIESSSSTKRGGKTTISKDIYVLHMDYSSTTINASFDPSEPAHATLEQKHDRPPPPPRKDQLESASSAFGFRIAEAASGKLGTTVGDGSAQAFILGLLRPMSAGALMPIGTRAYGALVYANLANTSTQVFDEIRAGDIVTFRNAKFSGHRGGLHSKYSMDVGMGGKDHPSIVISWDGTKKKIRAWEQGRDEAGKGGGKKGKVKEESFKVDDLKSGEVKVWRVMGRKWVGWDSGSGQK